MINCNGNAASDLWNEQVDKVEKNKKIWPTTRLFVKLAEFFFYERCEVRRPTTPWWSAGTSCRDACSRTGWGSERCAAPPTPASGAPPLVWLWGCRTESGRQTEKQTDAWGKHLYVQIDEFWYKLLAMSKLFYFCRTSLVHLCVLFFFFLKILQKTHLKYFDSDY